MKTLSTWQNKKVNILLCALVGLLAFLLLYGITPLNVTRDDWLYDGYECLDSIQHYAGWMFFRNSAWTFPLGVAQNMAAPTGAPVTFTDSIPLFAIFFKLLSPLLPATFQYFGIFVLCSFVLQGVFAGLLAQLHTQKRTQVLLVAVLFVTAPVLVDRAFRHAALSAQWLILWALYLYLKSKQMPQKTTAYKSYAVLGAVTVTIHPYFLPMVFGIMLADTLDSILAQKRFWRNLGKAALALLPCLAVAFCIGAVGFGGASLSDGTGYGYIGMNLNAPFNPGSWPAYKWSYVLPVRPLVPTLAQEDSFDYLGLGVLLGCFAAAVWLLVKVIRAKAWRKVGAFLLQNLGGVIAAVVFTLFAITHVVTYSSLVLFTLPLPKALLSLFSVFRASGRMFYPVIYGAMLWVAVSTLRALQGKWGTVLLAGVIGVQLLDCSGAYVAKHASFSAYRTPQVQTEQQAETASQWGQLAESYDTVWVLSDSASRFRLAYYLAKNDFVSNIAFMNRDMGASRAALKEQLLAGTADENALYLTSDEAEAAELAPMLAATGWHAYRLDSLDGYTDVLFAKATLPLANLEEQTQPAT